ncbi:MAG: alpha/beta hydrolase [Ruminococcus sp.]|nr:alpha/beta hydrolase [Ruminococcus sp.]
MTHIKNKQIHPELRLLGSTLRLAAPFMKVRMMPGMKQMQDKIMKGRWPGKFSNCESVEVPRGDGTFLRLLVCMPYHLNGEVPGLLWIHGGGYALGLPEQDVHFVKRFMEAADCVVVLPDYTKSVEKPYPAALEDCYLALKWMRVHAKEYGIRRDQLFVGGDSAGGGLTAALTLYARDKGEVSIAFQMPLYPMIDDRPTSTSKDNDAPVWNTASNIGGWQLYLGELYGTKDVPIYAAPARAKDLSGLPPACSYIGTLEPFYAEAVTYMLRLKEAGVPVHFKRFHGCFHGFDIVSQRSTPVKEASRFSAEAFQYAVKNYFAKQPGEE